MGIQGAFRTALRAAMNDPKFRKVFEATPANGGGSRAYQDNDIRVDHGEPGIGNRVIQIQAQAANPTLKQFAQEYGTHTKVAVLPVNEGGPNDYDAFFEEAVSQAGRF